MGRRYVRHRLYMVRPVQAGSVKPCCPVSTPGRTSISEDSPASRKDKKYGIRLDALADGKVELEDAGVFFCTAYCTEQYQHICGEGRGITASGQPIQAGVTVAADQSIFPYGTVLYIEGVGIRIVQDKGAGVQGTHLDVAVDTHENALTWSGYGEHRVWILKGE